jgi:hypothetical protein
MGRSARHQMANSTLHLLTKNMYSAKRFLVLLSIWTRLCLRQPTRCTPDIIFHCYAGFEAMYALYFPESGDLPGPVLESLDAGDKELQDIEADQVCDA